MVQGEGWRFQNTRGGCQGLLDIAGKYTDAYLIRDVIAFKNPVK
jgi:hypothetical protein